MLGRGASASRAYWKHKWDPLPAMQAWFGLAMALLSHHPPLRLLGSGPRCVTGAVASARARCVAGMGVKLWEHSAHADTGAAEAWCSGCHGGGCCCCAPAVLIGFGKRREGGEMMGGNFTHSTPLDIFCFDYILPNSPSVFNCCHHLHSRLILTCRLFPGLPFLNFAYSFPFN
jgi:hypothetical protein